MKRNPANHQVLALGIARVPREVTRARGVGDELLVASDERPDVVLL
jgi:hypothetical protein